MEVGGARGLMYLFAQVVESPTTRSESDRYFRPTAPGLSPSTQPKRSLRDRWAAVIQGTTWISSFFTVDIFQRSQLAYPQRGRVFLTA